jgi:drug/metabolite transporter (DMT)-like permease
MEERPKIPLPQIVYGKITYWLCFIAALICTIGTVLAIAFPDRNFMDPHYLFFNIWEGNNPETVWQQVGGGFPGGHFWLHNLNAWDGVTHFGIVIGCACAFLALLGASIAFLREKPRSYRWVLVSLCVAAMVILSLLGIYHV